MEDFNPFDDLIVKEPTRKEPAVPGLNEKPLRKLLAGFERVAPDEVPFPSQQLDQAVLVTSAEPGFGKSHLIGQLFRTLQGRATLIYVRPFQNPGLAFHSLLATVGREMHFPDGVDRQSWKPEDPTQLDVLAHGVIGHLVADLAEQQGETEKDKVKEIRRDPMAAFGLGAKGDTWADWMRETFATHRTAYEQALVRRGLRLNSPEWLRVLFAYGFGYPNREVRQACLDWIAGQSLSAEQAQLVGLRPVEAPAADQSENDTNHTSRLRLADLCELASFYRPFVFCFDQTEAYGHSPTLARTFGMVIATLVNEASNHFTLVTSNQVPWEKTIAKYFEDADLQRIARPSVALEGLTREQGEELIRLRIEGCGVDDKMQEGMLSREWLNTLFATDRDRRGARRFLQDCKERWEKLLNQPVTRASLAELYEARWTNMLAEPKRLLFNADTLQWLVKTAARGLAEWKVGPDTARYFSILWTGEKRRITFGFEPGSNWNRWGAIAREAQALYARDPALKMVVFRAAEQRAIPGEGWEVGPEIEAAKRSCLHILLLSKDDFAALHAGYDLYAEALGGDIPFTGEEVIAFLAEQFLPWWERIASPLTGAKSEPPKAAEDQQLKELVERVRSIVSSQKFLSVEEVLERLPKTATKEDVLKACGYSAAIRVHAHPNMTVLQWQNI